MFLCFYLNSLLFVDKVCLLTVFKICAHQVSCTVHLKSLTSPHVHSTLRVRAEVTRTGGDQGPAPAGVQCQYTPCQTIRGCLHWGSAHWPLWTLWSLSPPLSAVFAPVRVEVATVLLLPSTQSRRGGHAFTPKTHI